MSSDVRHRMRHALEIGPRRNNLSYPHTPSTPPKSVSGEWIDGKEKRERQWQSSYVDRDISFNFVSRIRRQSPIVNVTNTGDIFCYIITTILLSMIKREIDYLLSDVQSSPSRLLFKKFISKWKVKIANAKVEFQKTGWLYFRYFSSLEVNRY